MLPGMLRPSCRRTHLGVKGLTWLLVAVLALPGTGIEGAQAAQPEGMGAPHRVLLWPSAQSSASQTMESALARGLRREAAQLWLLGSGLMGPALSHLAEAEARDLRRVESQFEAAHQAYLAFRFDEARRLLRELRDKELPVLTRPSQLELLAEVFRLASRVELAEGRPQAAGPWARTASFLSPNDLTRAVRLPEYVQLETRERAEAERSARRGVRVTSEPAGAEVYWNGRFLGTTPLVADAAPGLHTVRLESPGHEVFARLHEVGAAGDPLHAALDGDSENSVLLQRIARGTLDVRQAPWRDALMLHLGATHLVVYQPTAGAPRLSLYRRGGRDRPLLEARGAPDSAPVAQRLARGILSDGSAVSDGPDGEGPMAAPLADTDTDIILSGGALRPRREGKRFYQSWWFWGAAGVLLASGALGLYFATRPEQWVVVRPETP